MTTSLDVSSASDLGGSSADILGGYGSQFAAPTSAPANDLLGFDSWSALASGAGAGSGGSDFRHSADAGATMLGGSTLDSGTAYGGMTDHFGRPMTPTDHWGRLMS